MRLLTPFRKTEFLLDKVITRSILGAPLRSLCRGRPTPSSFTVRVYGDGFTNLGGGGGAFVGVLSTICIQFR